MMLLQSVGWIATAIFSMSYFSSAPKALRQIQAVAAFLWIIYGLAIHAYPVVIANTIVVIAALYSASRRERETANS